MRSFNSNCRLAKVITSTLSKLFRLLVVSPRFPPSSAADSQRVRMLLPYLLQQGVDAEVLAVEPSCCPNELDSWQSAHLPNNLPIHRVRGLPLHWARVPGLGSLDARCHAALAKTGSSLLQTKHFDLVYFSTTEFGCFRLGPVWKRHHGVRFVLDYQDPWVNDHYRSHPEIPPPGGRLKYAIVDALSRWTEPRVLREASGYTSVSQEYPKQLQARYSFAGSIPALVLPFPASQLDFCQLTDVSDCEFPFDPHDGFIHWVSIGRGGADLHQALRGLFAAISNHAPDNLRKNMKLHFIGTSYAPSGKGVKTIAPLAAQYGLEDIVNETTDRIPFSTTLAVLRQAHALLVIGSNDASYTASKLYPYLLARRPLLAIVRQESSVASVIETCAGGYLVTFNRGTSELELASRIGSSWLADGQHMNTQPLDEERFDTFTAKSQAKLLATFFERVLSVQHS